MRKPFIFLFVLALGFASCTKRDESVMTDYTAQKASADKLITEVNEGMSRLKTEHAAWMADLEKAAADKNADTARINGFHTRMTEHEADAARVMALVDSVKLYTNASTEDDEALKAASARLSANFDDLNGTWRNLQDAHTQLGQDIQSFVVNAAGESVRADSAAAKTASSGSSAKTGHETVKKTTGGAAKNSSTSSGSSSGKASDHETVRKTEGGATKNSSTSSGTSSTPSSGKASDHETVRKTEGGATKNSSTK